MAWYRERIGNMRRMFESHQGANDNTGLGDLPNTGKFLKTISQISQVKVIEIG